MFVRWSRGPEVDLRGRQSSKDALTGVRMPGLSANPLRVEPLVRCLAALAWIARRVIDEAERVVDAEKSAEWGPLDRR